MTPATPARRRVHMAHVSPGAGDVEPLCCAAPHRGTAYAIERGLVTCPECLMALADRLLESEREPSPTR